MFEECLIEADHSIRRNKEYKFSNQWDHLNQKDKKQLVSCLLERDLLPQKIKIALEIFNGEVVKLF